MNKKKKRKKKRICIVLLVYFSNSLDESVFIFQTLFLIIQNWFSVFSLQHSEKSKDPLYRSNNFKPFRGGLIKLKFVIS